jgi:hypothetical protein
MNVYIWSPTTIGEVAHSESVLKLQGMSAATFGGADAKKTIMLATVSVIVLRTKPPIARWDNQRTWHPATR